MDERDRPVVFSEWIQRRRKALDMTQDELAKRAGCSVGALRKIESGERRPSKQLAGLLAAALEIPMDDQQTFIRIARGDLNLERLGQPSHQSPRPLPSIASLLQAQPRPDLYGTRRPPESPHRIPAPSAPLIGRDDELAALERLFKDPGCRLLTLTGIGGIGKTRLAIEFALRVKSDFPGGVFYVPLSAVNSPDKIVPAVADVFGFRFSGPADPREQLFSLLSGQIMQDALFVFDNLEHLLGQVEAGDDQSGVVVLVAEILQRIEHVKILGTSRERLDLHGEWIYELRGLPVPPTSFAGRAEGYDSVALFVKSAQRIRPDFQASAEDQQSLVQISQLVDGVPLAIELAAAWVGVLSCQEIAREIKSSLDFLTSSIRDFPERHRSIRATFDHSWKLLSAEEQRALCQLAVFHGGFDRSAAQQVAGSSLPLLASLSAKSLVRRTESGRYDLHEVIRQYALSHLVEHQSSLDTQRRHCEYFLGLVRDSADLLKTGAQQETIRRLTGEIGNILAAWAWAIEHMALDQLEQAGRGLGWYFEITGLYREGIDQLEQVAQALITRPLDDQKRRIMGIVLIHQALLYFRKGEFETARKLYEESISFLRPIGDQALLADALGFLGTVLHLQGEYDRAKSSLEESLYLARQSGARWFEAWAVFNLGYLDSLIGRERPGYEQMRAGIEMWRAIGDPQSIALGLNFLVPTLNKLGLFEEAKTLMFESLALCEQSKNLWGMGTAYRFLGLAYLADGQPVEAQAYLLKSLEVFGKFAQGWDIARSLTYLGDAAMMAGSASEAREFYIDGLRSSIEASAIPIALDALAGLGELQAKAGMPENALLFCYVIRNHPYSEGDTKHRADKLRGVQESILSPSQVMAMQAKALEYPFEEIVKLALDTAGG